MGLKIKKFFLRIVLFIFSLYGVLLIQPAVMAENMVFECKCNVDTFISGPRGYEAKTETEVFHLVIKTLPEDKSIGIVYDIFNNPHHLFESAYITDKVIKLYPHHYTSSDSDSKLSGNLYINRYTASISGSLIVKLGETRFFIRKSYSGICKPYVITKKF